MLTDEEERIVEKFVNAIDILEGFKQLKDDLITTFPEQYNTEKRGRVHVAMDNRPHSPDIAELIK